MQAFAKTTERLDSTESGCVFSGGWEGNVVSRSRVQLFLASWRLEAFMIAHRKKRASRMVTALNGQGELFEKQNFLCIVRRKALAVDQDRVEAVPPQRILEPPYRIPRRKTATTVEGIVITVLYHKGTEGVTIECPVGQADVVLDGLQRSRHDDDQQNLALFDARTFSLGQGDFLGKLGIVSITKSGVVGWVDDVS